MPNDKEIRTAIRKGITKPSQGASHQFWSIYNILNAIAYNKELNKKQIRSYTRLSPVTVQRVLTMCEEKKLVNKEVRAHNRHVYTIEWNKAKEFLVKLWAWKTIKTIELILSKSQSPISILDKILKNYPVSKKVLERITKQKNLSEKYKGVIQELYNLYGVNLWRAPVFKIVRKYASTYEKHRYEVQYLVKRDKISVIEAIDKVKNIIFTHEERERIAKFRKKTEGERPMLGTIESWKQQNKLLRQIRFTPKSRML